MLSIGSRWCGETRFPYPLTRWEGGGGRGPPRTTFLSSLRMRAGGPRTQAPGRVWAGAVLPRTTFPGAWVTPGVNGYYSRYPCIRGKSVVQLR